MLSENPNRPAITTQEFRRMFQECIGNDPELVRQILRPLIGAVIPIAAGTCSINPADICPGAFTFAENADDEVPLTAKAKSASQTANLQEWQEYDGTVLAVVDKDGHFGVGTSSPTQQLHVNSGGSTRMLCSGATADGTIGLDLDSTMARKWTLGVKGTNESGALILFDDTASQRRLTVDSSGRFGIGTSSPGARLEVQTGAAGTIGLIVKGATSQTANLQRWNDSSGNTLVAVAVDSGNPTLVFNGTAKKQSSSGGGPELISAQGSDQDDVVMWCGLTDDDNARFLFSYRGFLEWGPGTTGDQDVALFRNQQPGLSIQNFTSTSSDRAFSVNAATSSGGSEFPLFVVNTEDRSMRLAPGLISGDKYADSDVVISRGEITTTDATAAAIFTLPLTDGRAYFITAKVVGRKSDGTDRAFYWKTALVYRQSAGAVVQGGSPAGVVTLATVESSGAGSWDCTITTNGNDIEVQVTGQFSTTIHWVATIEYQSVATSS